MQRAQKQFCHDPRHKRAVNLSGLPIKGYPHSGGWKVPGVQGDPDEDGLYWLYIKCPRCGYEWSLWKLGVSRYFDPTAQAKVQALKADLPTLRAEEDRRDYLPGPEELSE